jgi:glycosyltransferase involved in cell wall biosynthesis
MRVLFLNPVGTVGGAERVLLTAVAGLRRAEPGWPVRVLTLADGPLAGEVRALGAEAEVVPLPAALARLGDSQLRGGGGRLALAGRAALAAPRALGYVARARAAVRRYAPDLVHSNGIKTHLLSRLIVSRGLPVVWHLHDFYSHRPLAATLLHRAAGRVRAGVAISKEVATDAAHVLPSLPVTTVLNAVDLARFSPTGPAADLDALAGLPPAAVGTVRVGLVATYARWKGHLTVLDAAALSAEAEPDRRVRWYIVGGPIYATAAQFTAEELRQAAATRGLAGRVGFVPFVPNPAGVYRGLDVVVHASTLPEPFGLTVAEAMACGRAVVASGAGGVAELITPGHDGLITPPGNAAGLMKAVRHLAGDQALRERLGAAARDTARARFDDARYGPELAGVYRSCVTPGGGKGGRGAIEAR